MKPQIKIILIICCLTVMGTSFMYHFSLNYNSLDEVKASVHVNIEIDKAYAPFVSIMTGLQSGDRLFSLVSEYISGIRNTIMYTEIRVENSIIPFVRKLFLRIPREEAQKTLSAIDNIGIFIGNKCFYFSYSDIVNLQGVEQGDYILYELHGLEYEKSAVLTLFKKPQWINWYGDFNFAIKAVSDFFIHPERYILTWIYLICFLIICRTNIENVYSLLRKQKKFSPEFLLLGFIVLVGFVLRLNGYVRYSSWVDELYSACQASNPALPFMNTFGDPGNPPLYFILLRFWFLLFGWTEQSGRFLSVLIGSAAIVSLYVMVKQFANKKTAFLAAAYMAASAYFIGFSQEMRAYILEVFLVSIVAFRFLIIMQKRELIFIDLVWYIIPSVLLVNTHYYGGLFIFANFLFFTAYSIRIQTFTWKRTGLFFAVNLIIAFSLLPFFIHTALRRAMLDSGFNTWIQKPGLTLICIAALIPILGILYIYLRRILFQNILSGTHVCFPDYAIFTTSAVYFIAFGISLYRPILYLKYLIILYPLLIAVIAMIFINIFTNNSKLIGGLCVVFAFFWITVGYEADRGGWMDVYHESLAYISRDAEAHPQCISVENDKFTDSARFYGYKQLPVYVSGENYDVLYFNPLHRSEEEMYSEIARLGINADMVLRIRVNSYKSVFKIYSDNAQ